MAVPFSGIFWTVAPAAFSRLRAPGTTPSEPFRVEIDDPHSGRIALTGALHLPRPPVAARDERRLIVALHGLGGSIESSYMRQFAGAANASGVALLRLNLRGADRSGADFYHAGLTSDLDAVLASPRLEPFGNRALVGFSLGGHVALRWAGERGAEAGRSVAAIATVSTPLDLELGARALDAPGSALYRRWILSGLNQQLDAVERSTAERGETSLVHVERSRRHAVRTIREWDRLVVAPRWGFASAEDYYARASAAPLFSRIAIPAWTVYSEADPMVPAATVRPALSARSSWTEVSWTARGGHVGMPADLDLGRSGEKGLFGQILAWLAEPGRRADSGERASPS